MKLSESFYSIQGEGVTTGVPSYFVRLEGCNLMCGGPGGCLMKQGKASWWCDTEIIWRQGKDTTNEEMIQKMQGGGSDIGVDVLKGILDGNIHIVWTGGEPTMERNRKDIANFIQFINRVYPSNKAFHELETNGTIYCPDGFYDLMDQINCSPKLANSGMTIKSRVVPEAIKQINEHRNGWFKIVISIEEDLKEIKETFLEPFYIEAKKVVLMPGVDNLNALHEVTKFMYEMCKKYGYRGVTRGHILAWNKTVGV